MNPRLHLACVQIPDAARPVLAAMDLQGSSPPRIAFRGHSALAFVAGDLTGLTARPEVLVRSMSAAAALAGRHVTAWSIEHVSAPHQPTPAGARPTPALLTTRAARALRGRALDEAINVAVVDEAFARGGTTSTVAALTPGWASAVAMAHVAETEWACAEGRARPGSSAATTIAALDLLLEACALDRAGVGRTFEQMREQDREPLDRILERFFAAVDRRPDLVAHLDAVRVSQGREARGLNAMFDDITFATISLGFEPRPGPPLRTR